jgi:MSHA pilin protein MshD
MKTCRQQLGVTLFELIMALVIIGTAAALVLGVYTNTVVASADPMVRQQAVAVAEAYMDEIMSRPFSGTINNPRAQRDNIDAYDGTSDSPPRNINGQTIAGLDNLTAQVSVTVSNDFIAAAGAERLIEVRVFDSAGTVDITLSAYRTDW